jgi:hypothetical protein
MSNASTEKLSKNTFFYPSDVVRLDTPRKPFKSITILQHIHQSKFKKSDDFSKNIWWIRWQNNAYEW